MIIKLVVMSMTFILRPKSTCPAEGAPPEYEYKCMRARLWKDYKFHIHDDEFYTHTIVKLPGPGVSSGPWLNMNRLQMQVGKIVERL